ncbi:hypothetical protein ATM97_29000 [Nocardia sp. MH4]|nr:hypothetical protein [Nocardia sp. MH4]
MSGLVLSGVCTGLQGIDAGGEFGIAASPRQCHLGVVGIAQGCVGFASMQGQVAEAGQDVDVEMVVSADDCEVQGAAEVLVGLAVVSGIMSHPPGHFGEAGGGGEQRAGVASLVSPEQSGRDIGVQVVDDRGVEVSTAQ